MSRSGLLLLTACVGCASASATRNGPPDANEHDAALHDGTLHDGTIDTPSGSCATPFTGLLATWDFMGAPGSQASTPASAMAPGITAGAISRAAGLTAASGATSINSSNWPSGGTLDPTKYYTLSITPPGGCLLDITSGAVDVKASGTGPASGALATSDDGFAASVAIGTAAPSSPTLAVSGASSAVEIRIYGFSATSTSGTMRVESSLTFSGALR